MNKDNKEMFFANILYYDGIYSKKDFKKNMKLSDLLIDTYYSIIDFYEESLPMVSDFRIENSVQLIDELDEKDFHIRLEELVSFLQENDIFVFPTISKLDIVDNEVDYEIIS